MRNKSRLQVRPRHLVTLYRTCEGRVAVGVSTVCSFKGGSVPNHACDVVATAPEVESACKPNGPQEESQQEPVENRPVILREEEADGHYQQQHVTEHATEIHHHQRQNE